MLMPLRSILFGSVKAAFVSKLSSAHVSNSSIVPLLGSRVVLGSSTKNNVSSVRVGQDTMECTKVIDNKGIMKDHNERPGR